jgi:hypothetical protein
LHETALHILRDCSLFWLVRIAGHFSNYANFLVGYVCDWFRLDMLLDWLGPFLSIKQKANLVDCKLYFSLISFFCIFLTLSISRTPHSKWRGFLQRHCVWSWRWMQLFWKLGWCWFWRSYLQWYWRIDAWFLWLVWSCF